MALLFKGLLCTYFLPTSNTLPYGSPYSFLPLNSEEERSEGRLTGSFPACGELVWFCGTGNRNGVGGPHFNLPST